MAMRLVVGGDEVVRGGDEAGMRWWEVVRGGGEVVGGEDEVVVGVMRFWMWE